MINLFLILHERVLCRIILIFTFLNLISSIVYPQSQKYVRGFVIEKSSGEKLIGANILDKVSLQTTITNDNGYFFLYTFSDTFKLSVSYIGYKDLDTVLTSTSGEAVIFSLEEENYSIEEVEVKASIPLETSRSLVFSQRIDPRYLKQIPSLIGESDPMKALVYLPGVTMGREGSSSFYVRGGTPDQNLILLDGVPVYNISHVLGIFSVFIPETMREVELIKGGFPARYGGRLSSVVDVRMKEGDINNKHVNFSVGTLASKLIIEGPLVKEKVSYILGARRTYADIFLKPLISQSYFNDVYTKQTVGLHFYDITGKLNYKINDIHQAYFSIYTGEDMLKMKLKYTIDNTSEISTNKLYWGNFNWVVRLHSILSDRMFSSLFIYQSNFDYNTGSEYSFKDPGDDFEIHSQFDFSSRIKDIGMKWHLDHRVTNQISLLYGLEAILHKFTPGMSVIDIEIKGSGNRSDRIGHNLTANEYNGFVELTWDINDKNVINAGIRNHNYFESGKWFRYLEPRISINHALNENIHLKSGFTVMNQPLHMVVNSGIGIPMDLWLPATNKVKSQEGWQIDGGLFTTIKQLSGTNISCNIYYKRMNNIVAFREGIAFAQTDLSYEEMLTDGRGISYGSEFLIEKNCNRFNGWLSYTLSKHDRKFALLNDGKSFPFKYDKRHEINLFGNYAISKKIDFAFTWNFASGYYCTLPSGMYKGNGDIAGTYFYDYFLGEKIPDEGFIDNYTSVNNVKMPLYHRMDLSFNFKKVRKSGERIWNIGIYNIYNRKNPYYIYWEVKEGKRELKQFSLFQMIPGITYNYKF